MKVVDVPASDALRWFKVAWRDYFVKSPLGWISAMGLWLLSQFLPLLLGLLPLVLIIGLLQPILFAGLMHAARDQDLGQEPKMGAMLSGFRFNGGALFQSGCIMFVVFALLSLAFQPFMPELPAVKPGEPVDQQAVMRALQDKSGVLLLMGALVALLKGVFWFVPPLLAFQKMSAMHAIRWSLYAFLSNFGAVILYGLIMFVLFAAVMFTLGALLVLVLPLMAITNYVGYKAMFVEDLPEDPRTGMVG